MVLPTVPSRRETDMTTHFESTSIFNTASDGIDLLSGDSLFIDAGVTVAGGTAGGDYAGVDVGGSGITAQIDGMLWGNDDGISVSGGDNLITVGASGSVVGNRYDALILGGTGNVITNNGEIISDSSSDYSAIDLHSFSSGDNTIVNNGTIIGAAGIGVVDGGNTIDNSGLIVGIQDNAITLYTSSATTDTIDNSGTLETTSANGALEDEGAGTLVVTNSGHIAGGISLTNGGTDTIDNTGTITAIVGSAIAIEQSGVGTITITNSGHIAGGITFGSGTNVYDGTLGSVTGWVTGGSGSDSFTGGAGTDHLDGGTGTSVLDGMGGNDVLMAEGTQATIDGGDGNDTINMASFFNASDEIDGGAGKDKLVLDGDYSAGVTLNANTLTNVEKIVLDTGFNYTLTMDDNNVAAGQQMTVDASALTSSYALKFDGSAETDGRYVLDGGAGNDYLTGGAGNDVLTGNGGDNRFTGGGGEDRIVATGDSHDRFIYTDVSDSTSTTHDVIVGFSATADAFDLDVTVTGISTEVTSGRLSTASFDANLASAIGSGQLAAGHAVLFTPTTGNLAGHTFLIVDANGVAGYQAGQDYVFDVTGAAHLNLLATSDFI
jgi:Ca2+-binding RTX toxin-like protein